MNGIPRVPQAEPGEPWLAINPDMTGEKELTTEGISELLRRTVQIPEKADERPFGSNLVFLLANTGDELPAWGTDVWRRDLLLRRFFGQESFTTSAISSVVARNMGFNWQISTEAKAAATATQAEGGEPLQVSAPDQNDTLVELMQNRLHSSDLGEGWQDFIAKFSLDLYTQDRGPKIEVIRTEDREDAEVLGLNHLDALRCFSTGDPLIPVIYQNRMGRWVKLPWYRVLTPLELPAPHEQAYGLQYCALSRILKAAQIFRNIAVYQEEKTGGRHTRAIHIVSGVQKGEINDAINIRMAQADAQGMMRYMQPAILATLDPQADPKLVTLELATIPDAWKMEEMFKFFITVVALGLWSDYGDFAPLPGNGLGTAAQSETMKQRSTGKGSAVFRSMLEFELNFRGVMPRGLKFEFKEPDLAGDAEAAAVTQARAEARSVMIKNQEIDGKAARQMALASGDITQQIFDDMEQRDAEAEALGLQAVSDQLSMLESVTKLTPPPFGEPPASPPFGGPFKEARTSIPKRAGPEADRVAFEDDVAARLEPALQKARDMVVKKLRSLK